MTPSLLKDRSALYLRSSKDRHDVSIDSQRRELLELARNRGLRVVQEYVDAVESAKDEYRPGLQNLLRDLKAPDRPWSNLLMLDTSRLSRRRYFAHAFKHECDKRGVTVSYAKVPDVDTISAVILESVLAAMDEVHSLMSREKGIAGMTENVRQGYRAGGRAPRGYQLEKIETGAVREGAAVTKSRLRPSPEALAVTRYLKLRAGGTRRAEAKRQAGIDAPDTSLIGIEWNALTYAGHTVWNQTAEKVRKGGGYKGGRKYRPREEWIIQRNTHDALISENDAETILSSLLNSTMGSRIRAAKAGESDYLLTGLLYSPDGRAWTGDHGKYYRLKSVRKQKGKLVPREDLDRAVLDALFADIRSPEYVRKLLGETRKMAATAERDPAKDLRTQITKLNQQIDRLMDLALEAAEPGPYQRKADDLEKQRKALFAEVEQVQREYSLAAAAKKITEDQVLGILDSLAEELSQSTQIKNLLPKMVERVVLDPLSLETVIHYAVQVADNRPFMASPRGVEPLSPP